MPKQWYQSKTIWIGILSIAIGVLSFLADNPDLGIFATASGIIGVVLRYLTSSPLEQ